MSEHDSSLTRVLLVEDDEEDFILTRDALLAGAAPERFELHWARGFDEGFAALGDERFDVVLLDYRLGAATGIDVLHALGRDPAAPPVILLTGQNDREMDLQAMRAGAVDFLVKSELTPALLERAIRYAVERRANEAARRETEARYGELVEMIGAIVWQADLETLRFSLVSREAELLLGYPVRRWLEEPDFWEAHLHPDDRERTVGLCRDAALRGEPHTLEYRMIAADGRAVWLRDVVRVAWVGGRRQLIGVMVDITAAREAQEELHLRGRVIEAAAEGILITDPLRPDNPIVYANPAFTAMTGYAPEEAIGRNCRFLQGPGTDPAARSRIHAALAAEQPVSVELLNYRKDGTPFWNYLSISPVRDEGRVVRFVGVQQDVTERKEATARLHAAEAHYRRLVESSPYGIFALDASGRPIEASPAMCEIVGRPLSELLQLNFLELLAPEERVRARELFEAVLAGQLPDAEVELWNVLPSGERRLVHTRSVPIVVDGEIVGVHGVARDVTEERARDRQRRLLEAALNGLRDEGVTIFDPERGLIYVNAAHARIHGYDPVSRPPSLDALLPEGDSRAEVEEMLAEARRTGTWSGRVRRRRLDTGAVVPLDFTVGRVEVDGRELFFSILRDATQKIATEQHLRRAERLAGIGTLLAGVAHELNNPLHAIAGFASLMLMDERGTEDLESLSIIKREAERAAGIVANLRSLARQSQQPSGERAAVDLNDVVAHVLRVRGYTLSTRGIEVETDLAAELPAVLGDRGQLEQVLLNLVVNAEQAMQGWGGARVLHILTRASTDGISIRVSDTGPGVPVEHFERLFDPFFTTKAPGEGTGLGLSLVHGIVHEHGGRIVLESEPGRGATFQIDLPRAPTDVPTTAAAGAAPGQPEAPPRSLRILVVDDEPAVRRAISRFLTRRGHEADLAGEGEEALAMLDAAVGRYDVIVSDFRMPGLRGDQLLERLRQRGRGEDRCVIFLTGDAAGGEAASILAGTGVPVLYKPLDLLQLARAVEQHAELTAERA